MYDFKLVNGDIVLQGGGLITTVSGKNRIQQELSCWILEPLGFDKTYTKFGSTLENMIGNPIVDQQLNELKNEVARVVSNYMAYQKRQYNTMLGKSKTNSLNSWSADDLIKTVDSIDVSTIADTVRVVVKLSTNDNQQIVIEQSV